MNSHCDNGFLSGTNLNDSITLDDISFRTETMTLPKLVRKTSPTPMCQILGFMSNGIKRQDAKAPFI